MHTLVLWDIDGTLLKGSRAATQAFNHALREVYELGMEPARIDYGGKTDSQIALEVLRLHDIAEEHALDRLAHFHDRYIQLLHDVYDALQASVEVLPGAPEVIDRLAASGAIQSVLTGNLEATAELKLRAARLHDRLELRIGAFGSDHRDRDELVPIAAAKAARLFGRAERIVVVGDTPRDVACGKAGNARTVAVATGNWSFEELLRCAPDVVLASLADVDRACAAILGQVAPVQR